MISNTLSLSPPPLPHTHTHTCTPCSHPLHHPCHGRKAICSWCHWSDAISAASRFWIRERQRERTLCLIKRRTFVTVTIIEFRVEDCKVACSTPAFRLWLINLSKLARCSHQGLFRVPRLRSHSNCLRAFSSLKRSIGNECYQNSVLLPLTGNGALGSLHTAPDTSWEELRGRRGGALSFSIFSIYPPLCITVPLKWAARLWSVYPRLCQSKLVSWRLHSSALQYLCLLPCLRFLMTKPL